MAEVKDLERTLNGILVEKGYTVINSIENEHLYKLLTNVMIELAEGKYLDMRIVPGDVALQGSKWKLEKPSHIVYAKLNKEHNEYDPDCVYLVMPLMVHLETGEFKSGLPLNSIK